MQLPGVVLYLAGVSPAAGLGGWLCTPNSHRSALPNASWLAGPFGPIVLGCSESRTSPRTGCVLHGTIRPEKVWTLDAELVRLYACQ